jgi:hypothetical protein
MVACHKKMCGCLPALRSRVRGGWRKGICNAGGAICWRTTRGWSTRRSRASTAPSRTGPFRSIPQNAQLPRAGGSPSEGARLCRAARVRPIEPSCDDFPVLVCAQNQCCASHCHHVKPACDEFPVLVSHQTSVPHFIVRIKGPCVRVGGHRLQTQGVLNSVLLERCRHI